MKKKAKSPTVVMAMEQAKQIELLNKLLGGKVDEDILTFTLGKAEDMILNYCRLLAVPLGLERVLLNMAVDIYRAEQLGQETATGAVKSISEGDVSVSYASSTSASENLGMVFLKNYEGQLQRYRKVGW